MDGKSAYRKLERHFPTSPLLNQVDCFRVRRYCTCETSGLGACNLVLQGGGRRRTKESKMRVCMGCERFRAQFSLCTVVSTVGRKPRRQRSTSAVHFCSQCVRLLSPVGSNRLSVRYGASLVHAVNELIREMAQPEEAA